MRITIADKLVIDAGAALVSRALELSAPSNAVEVDIVVERMGASIELLISVATGNDLTGWSLVGGTTMLAAGVAHFEASGIAGRYVRLEFSADGTLGDKAVLSAGVEPKRL
jgi:hypothetical protein